MPELISRVQANPEKVQNLLEKMQRCSSQIGESEMLAWNNGWNQFGKPRG